MENSQNIVDINKLKISCSNCSLSELCLPHGLAHKELEELDQAIRQKKPLQPGEQLFSQGLASQAVYAVRSGALKTYYITESGIEQIVGFHLPGELVGLDSLASNQYRCYAEALITSSVCELPITEIEGFCNHIPGLQYHMLRIMSEELATGHEILTSLGKKNAEERLASLLISLSIRFHARGLSANEYQLPMSRTDIANYLGITVETVSRLFSNFQKQGLLSTQRRSVKIHDSNRLKELVGVSYLSFNQNGQQ